MNKNYSKKTILAVVLILLQLLIEVRTIEPGMVVSVRNQLVATLAQTLQKEVKFDQRVPDQEASSGPAKAGVYNVRAWLSRFNVGVDFNPSNNAVIVTLTNLQFRATSEARAELRVSNPIKDFTLSVSGGVEADIRLRDISGEIKFIHTHDGDDVRLGFELVGYDISWDSISTDIRVKIGPLPGISLGELVSLAFSPLIKVILTGFQEVFKKFLINDFAMKKAAELIPSVASVTGTDLSIRTTFAEPAISVFSDHLEISLDGTVFQGDDNRRADIPVPALPTKFDPNDPRNFQAFITSYSINAALYALGKSSLNAFDITNTLLQQDNKILTTTNLAILIPSVLDVYGPDKDFIVTLSADPSLPQNVELHKDQVKGTLSIRLAFNLDNEARDHIATLSIPTETTLNILSKYEPEEGVTYIKMQIGEILVKDVTVIDSNVEVEREGLLGMLEIGSIMAIPILNNLLDNNPAKYSSIHVNIMEQYEISQTKFSLEEGYVTIGAHLHKPEVLPSLKELFTEIFTSTAREFLAKLKEIN